MTENFRRSARKFCSIAGTFRNVLFPSRTMKIFITVWICEQNISDKEVDLTTKLVDVVLGQRWLQFEEQIWEQNDGLFIGNGLSSMLTEAFLGNLELRMEEKEWFPRIWFRYVDDVFAIINKGELGKTLEELNKCHINIKFTSEEESNGQLPFLDMLVIRKDNHLEFDIFRKPTDMPLCIPADSHHPMIHKLAAFESALYRMWAFPLNPARRETELKFIIKMAKMNGYKEDTILRLKEKHKRKRKSKDLCRLQPIREDIRIKKITTILQKV
jgi:hypothetical protein